VIQAADSDIWSKLLDWPALAFLLVLLFSIAFYKPISRALSRGDLVLSWGENRQITVTQLPKKLTEELDPLRDEIEALKAAVDALKKGAAPGSVPPVEPPGPQPLTAEEEEVAREKMLEALSSDDYLWRSVERLAVIAGISQEQAQRLLRADRRVVLGTGKSQRQIARLKSRRP
jgi:hypothetical protein